MNRQIFFAKVRAAPFPGRLTRGQVDGIERILDYRDERYPQVTDDQLAYMLATVFGETAQRMQPVRETLADTDAQAIARLENAKNRGRLPQVSTRYWLPDSDGMAWFGRGLVQITWKSNYQKFGVADDPSKALTWPVALDMLFRGMLDGMYTNHRLDQYVSGDKRDYRNARRTINGLDRAVTYSKWAEQFRKAFIAAREAKQADKEAAEGTQIIGTPMKKSTTARAAGGVGVLGALTPALEAARQATDAIVTGRSLSDAVAAAGPWILLAIVVAGLAAYIWRERKRHSVEDGV